MFLFFFFRFYLAHFCVYISQPEILKSFSEQQLFRIKNRIPIVREVRCRQIQIGKRGSTVLVIIKSLEGFALVETCIFDECGVPVMVQIMCSNRWFAPYPCETLDEIRHA